MAADKKNNSLHDDSDEETASQVAIVGGRFVVEDEEAEADADTFAFDQNEPDGRSVESLRSDLRSREERIGQLQFDVEQLRARWTGLEKEITAREEVTKNLQDDLRAADRQQRKLEKHLEKRDQQIEQLTGTLETAKDIERQYEVLKDAANQPDEESNVDLERELELERITVAELTTYIDGRQRDWDTLGKELASTTTELSDKTEALTQLEEEKSGLTRTISAAETEIASLNSKLAKAKQEGKRLDKKNHILARDIDNYQTDQKFNIDKRLAEQSGQLVSNRHDINELTERIARSEHYANDLRTKLDDQAMVSAADQAIREQLDSSLAQATQQVLQLTEQLETEKVLSARLQEEVDESKVEFENEVRQIRFELGSAQETIGDYETVNEELTSDLLDNTHFRHALEDQLASTEETKVRETTALTTELAQLKAQLEEIERKVSSKDSAITALLGELASKSQTIESIGEIGTVIHEIDNKMSEKIDDRSSQEKERRTRLLVGAVGGQELQFPLFKDRLTIGRTAQNDIQLKAHYISRRHAVILNDEDGPKIVDWGSKNGILVNGEKVLEQTLSCGDEVTIGTAKFIFEERQKR